MLAESHHSLVVAVQETPRHFLRFTLHSNCVTICTYTWASQLCVDAGCAEAERVLGVCVVWIYLYPSLSFCIFICVYNKPKCRRAQNMPPFVVACICFTIVFCSLLKLIEILYTQQEHGGLSSTETQCHETLKGVSERVKERTMSLSFALTRQINAKQRSSCVSLTGSVFVWDIFVLAIFR